ncbi:MAG: hypothetical protein Q9168_003426 [Polycauliona sp. 1 TL-2023]
MSPSTTTTTTTTSTQALCPEEEYPPPPPPPPSAPEIKAAPTTIANPPAWSQAETASSESAQRPIPPEEDYSKIFSWADVNAIVATNRLDLIRRKPSERVIYKEWCRKTIAAYGSITGYMCAERLRWTPRPDGNGDGDGDGGAKTTIAEGLVFDCRNPTTPFSSPNDFRILRNDWPYGSFGPEITHLIVWTKVRIATDAENGGLVTPEAKERIDAFVDETFVKRLAALEEGGEEDGGGGGPDAAAAAAAADDVGKRVLWFKNWGALQSVRGLEHIHVLVRDVPEAIVDEWTGETRHEG